MPEKKKTAVPRLRFPEFRDAGPWEVKRLGEIATKRTERNKEGRVIRVLTNSAENGVVDQRVYFKKDIAVQGNLSNYFVVHRGDFIYNPRISANAPVGPISRNNIGKGVMSPLYTVFFFNDPETDFFSYYFESSAWHSYVRSVGSTGARHDRMAISNEDFFCMPVPEPQKHEQQKIADCLSSLDDLIRAEESRLEALQAHKKGLIQQLFPREGETAPRLRFPEFRDAGPWEVKRLGDEDVAQFVRDRIPPENIPIGHYVSTVNLLPDFGGLAVEPEAPPPNNAIAYREGDILMSNIRPYLKKVWVADRSGGASNDVLVVRAGKSVVRAYLGHLLMSDQFIAHVMEGAKGVKMPRGDLEQIQDFGVPVPPKPVEQQKIADCLASLDDLIQAQGEKIKALKQHKKGLMQQLFPQEVG